MSTNYHHTKTKGDMGMAAVILDLTKSHYMVSTPLSEHCPYDLVVDIGKTLLKIQVKYRSFTKGNVPSRTTWVDGTGVHTNYIKGDEFDYYAIVNEDLSKIAYCPIELKGSTIRFEIPLSYTGFYWWEDFRLENKCIPVKRSIKEFPNTELLLLEKRRKSYQNRKKKISWPDNEILIDMISSMSMTTIGNTLGVSDNAVRKHCKRNNIDF